MWHWNEHGELIDPDGTKHSIATSILNEQKPDIIKQVSLSQSLTLSATPNVPHMAQPNNSLIQDVQAGREHPSRRRSRLRVFQNLCENQPGGTN
jgi:hypothetical protein